MMLHNHVPFFPSVCIFMSLFSYFAFGREPAEFCVAHARWLEGKSVLELGAGVGMTGAVVATCCGAREVVLTDYAPRCKFFSGGGYFLLFFL